MLDGHTYTIAMDTKRKAISTRSRFEVFKRDGFVCQYCGAHPPKIILHVDHIIPVSKGGKNTMDNYITSCDTCNLGKSNIKLSNIPKSLKDKALDVADKEKQIKGYYKIIEKKRKRIEQEAWEVAAVLDPNAYDGFDRKRLMSIRKFIKEIGYHEVLEAMEKSSVKFNNDYYAFKYFCGICWNIIKDR